MCYHGPARLPGVIAGLGNLYDCPFFMAATPTTQPQPKSRSIVYVDGFNFCYGAVRDTPRLKWLDLARYCRYLRPHDDLRAIRYFSAMVDGRTKPNQEAYPRALATEAADWARRSGAFPRASTMADVVASREIATGASFFRNTGASPLRESLAH